MSGRRKPKRMIYLKVTLNVLGYVHIVFKTRRKERLTLTIIFSPTCMMIYYTLYVIVRKRESAH